MKKIHIPTIVMIFSIFISCGGKRAGIVFAPTGSHMPPRTGSIAVICGHADINEFTIVSTVTGKLAESGSLRVISQEMIHKTFPSYPTNILISEETSGKDGEASGWRIENNMPAFRKIQKKLGVDYLMVVWVMRWEHSRAGFGSVGGGVASWLIKFPEENLAGKSYFGRVIRLNPGELLADDQVSSDRLAKMIGEELYLQMDSVWK